MTSCKPIYLIGPPGVGKTSCASAAVDAFDAELFKLDELCQGRTNDWPFCQKTMLELEASEEHGRSLRLVDIGAGTQHDCNRELSEFLVARCNRTVLIWGSATEVIRRNPLGPNRDPQEYLRTEYTSRERLYSVAKHKLDVSGLSELDAKDAFKKCLSSNFTR